MLLQIAEPGQSPKPHQHRLAIGIDLGTTNSLVASVISGSATPIADADGEVILPSVVRYLADGVQVGNEARDAAQSDPLNTLFSVKRLMGRGMADVRQLGSQLPYEFVQGQSQMPLIHTVQGNKSPVEISAEILKVLRARAEARLGGDLVGAVITVPAYFDDAQRQATKDAARLAGLTVLRLLNEPTAAAVAYGLDKGQEGIVAVYDLGGGTFDISILRLTKGVFEVMATGGDSALGGDDLDHVVAGWIIEQAGLSQELTPGQQRELLTLACDTKEQLTDSEAVGLVYGSWRGTLTRDHFDQLIEPIVARSLKACRRALRDAELEPEAVNAVVLVGGSTRVPWVRRQVEEAFGRPPLTDIDPDQVVAVGAAIQANMLAGNQNGESLLLLDVIPLSLGLETMGGLMEKVIIRNTTIPVTRAQDFTTHKDGQTAMMIHVLQGERDLVKDCRSLARFDLRGIPPLSAGSAKVRVAFQVDADGLLRVSARELHSDISANIEVKPSYGLTEAEISRMLKDSFQHAEEDRGVRRLTEIQVEAERLLEAVYSALEADGERLLDDDERAVIHSQAQRLKDEVAGSDAVAIERHTKKLTSLTDAFAARRMDAAVKSVLQGRQLNEIEA